MAALPAVSAATPPAIKPAFRSLLLFVPPPSAANTNLRPCREAGRFALRAKKSHDLAPCLARRRAAFVMASTSSLLRHARAVFDSDGGAARRARASCRHPDRRSPSPDRARARCPSRLPLHVGADLRPPSRGPRRRSLSASPRPGAAAPGASCAAERAASAASSASRLDSASASAASSTSSSARCWDASASASASAISPSTSSSTSCRCSSASASASWRSR